MLCALARTLRSASGKTASTSGCVQQAVGHSHANRALGIWPTLASSFQSGPALEQAAQESVESINTGPRPDRAQRGPPYDDRRQGARRPFDESFIRVGTIYVNSTKNNTICTLVDMRGNPVTWTSAGTEGFKNARKHTTTAAQATAVRLAEKCIAKGFPVVRLVMKGTGFGKHSAASALVKAGLRITEIHEATPVPHNGCRAPRKRRC